MGTELRMRQLREKYEGRIMEHFERFNAQEAQYLKRIEELRTQNKNMRAASHVVEYKKEQKTLVELKEHFAKVDTEKERIRSENVIASTRQKKSEAEQARRNGQASLLQAYWRAILQREEFVKIKKAAKKKGGGKKKK